MLVTPKTATAVRPAPPEADAPVLGTRIRDLSHVSFSLRDYANEVSRRPVAKSQMGSGIPKDVGDASGLLIALHDHLRTLTEARASAEAFEGPGVPEGLVARIDLAREAVAAVQVAAENAPSRGLGPLKKFIFTDADRKLFLDAAKAIDAAETAAARAQGPSRNQFELPASSESMFSPAKLAEALENPALEDAFERTEFPVQDAMAKLGPKALRVLLGKPTFAGEERVSPDAPVLFLPTHGHPMLDPLVLSHLKRYTHLPVRTLMLSFEGALGALYKKGYIPAGMVPIQRGRGRGQAALSVLNELLHRNNAGANLAEGRINKSDTPGTIKRGIAQSALEANVGIAPIAVYGGRRSAVRGDRGIRGLAIVAGEPVHGNGAPPTWHNIELLRDQAQLRLQQTWGEARAQFGTENAEPEVVLYR